MSAEKKMDINTMITRDDMIEKVAEGKKTAIRRQKRFADIDDTFVLAGKTYEITNVYKQLLGDVTEQNAKEEGYDDLNAYKESITSIHEGAVWTPKLPVWVHEFKLKNE